MEGAFHRIKVRLYPNPLTDDPGDLMARVVYDKNLDMAQVCESATTRGGLDVDPDTLLHYVKGFQKEVFYLVCNNCKVTTDLYATGANVTGKFAAADESFDPKRHHADIQFLKGAITRDFSQLIEVAMVSGDNPVRCIWQVTDVKTGSENSLLTPNCALRIKGRKIKIAGDDETVGVYFVNETSGEGIKADPSDIVDNRPSELIVTIPALSPGNYRLMVITQFTKADLLKTPRSILFDKLLTVP